MNLNDVESRLFDLDKQVKESNSVDFVKDAQKKKEQLLQRKAELQELEQRKKDIFSIENGAGQKKEERMGGYKVEEKTYGVNTPEYRMAFLKQMQGKELDVEERTALTAVSAVIPTTTMNQIIGQLELAPMIAAVDVSYIPGNVSFPVENAINDANWVEMATAATDAADSLSMVTLGAYKLIKTIEITADVQAMGIDAFERWLVARLVNKLEKAISNAILNGTGKNQPTGLLKSGEITNTGTFTKNGLTYKDILGIIASIPSQYMPEAQFVLHRTLFYGEVLGLTDTNGKPVIVRDPQSPAKLNILGYPALVDDNCPADTIIFGRTKGYKFNFASMPTVKSDESVGFRSGTTVYRGMVLCDGKLGDKNGLCVYTRATTA